MIRHRIFPWLAALSLAASTSAAAGTFVPLFEDQQFYCPDDGDCAAWAKDFQSAAGAIPRNPMPGTRIIVDGAPNTYGTVTRYELEWRQVIDPRTGKTYWAWVVVTIVMQLPQPGGPRPPQQQ